MISRLFILMAIVFKQTTSKECANVAFKVCVLWVCVFFFIDR